MRNDMAMRAERAWQAEREALRAEIARLRAQLAQAQQETPRPLPDLQTYGYDAVEVATAIRRRGIHPTEFNWLADLIEALDDYAERVSGD